MQILTKLSDNIFKLYEALFMPPGVSRIVHFKKLTFAPRLCLYCKSYVFGSKHKCNVTTKTVFVKGVFSLFLYNQSVKGLLIRYKQLGYKYHVHLIKKLWNYYVEVDPFNLVKGWNLASSLHNLWVYPYSYRNARGFDSVGLMLKYIGVNYSVPVVSGSIASQKTLDRLGRVRNRYGSFWQIKQGSTLQKFIKEKRIKQIVIFDDVITSGATIKSLTNYVLQLLLKQNISYNQKVSIIGLGLFYRPLRWF